MPALAGGGVADTTVTRYEFTGSPVVMMSTGSTDYQLVVEGMMPVENGVDSVLAQVKSRLEFPLDMTMVGFKFGFVAQQGSSEAWSIHGRALVNSGHPGDPMYDHDWQLVPSWGYEQKYSYTESDIEASYIILGLEFARRLLSGARAELSWQVGLTYQRYEADVIGYQGWHLSGDEILDQSGYGVGREISDNIRYAEAWSDRLLASQIQHDIVAELERRAGHGHRLGRSYFAPQRG